VGAVLGVGAIDVGRAVAVEDGLRVLGAGVVGNGWTAPGSVVALGRGGAGSGVLELGDGAGGTDDDGSCGFEVSPGTSSTTNTSPAPRAPASAATSAHSRRSPRRGRASAVGGIAGCSEAGVI
jgi:hypothetical protein